MVSGNIQEHVEGIIMSHVVMTHGGTHVNYVNQPMGSPQVIQTVNAPILIRENYPATTSRALGICLIVGGVLGIACAIMGIIWGAHSANSGYGIWCNAPVIVTGILAIVAANKKTQIITAVLALDIISLCAVGLMGLIAIIALNVDRDLCWLCWDEENDPLRSNQIAVDAVLLSISVILAGLLLWTSIISCNCCQTVPGSTVTAVSTVNHATVASYPPQQGYAPQPQYGPPPAASPTMQPGPGYHPNQGPPPQHPPPYAPGSYDNYGGNYPRK